MLELQGNMYRGKIENHVSASELLNGKLKIEVGKNVDYDDLDRDVNVAIYNLEGRLVINALTDIDILIAKLQKVREELF